MHDSLNHARLAKAKSVSTEIWVFLVFFVYNYVLMYLLIKRWFWIADWMFLQVIEYNKAKDINFANIGINFSINASGCHHIPFTMETNAHCKANLHVSRDVTHCERHLHAVTWKFGPVICISVSIAKGMVFLT